MDFHCNINCSNISNGVKAETQPPSALQVRAAYESSKRDMDAASEGSLEAAEAQIGVETSKAMAAAIGVVLA